MFLKIKFIKDFLRIKKNEKQKIFATKEERNNFDMYFQFRYSEEQGGAVTKMLIKINEMIS
jgi:hypothetical protein